MDLFHQISNHLTCLEFLAKNKITNTKTPLKFLILLLFNYIYDTNPQKLNESFTTFIFDSGSYL